MTESSASIRARLCVIAFVLFASSVASSTDLLRRNEVWDRGIDYAFLLGFVAGPALTFRNRIGYLFALVGTVLYLTLYGILFLWFSLFYLGILLFQLSATQLILLPIAAIVGAIAFYVLQPGIERAVDRNKGILEMIRLVFFVLSAVCCIFLDVIVSLDIHSGWDGVYVALVTLLLATSFFIISLGMLVSKSVCAEYGITR